MGLFSISETPEVYAQNEKGLPRYYDAVNTRRLPVYRDRLSEDDRLRRHVIMKLMCTFALDVRAVEKAFAIDFADTLLRPLPTSNPWQRTGSSNAPPTA